MASNVVKVLLRVHSSYRSSRSVLPSWHGGSGVVAGAGHNTGKAQPAGLTCGRAAKIHGPPEWRATGS
jgi:hypothetical protein